MTVALSPRTAGPYLCTGGETVFAYVFRILSALDLSVYLLRGGVITPMVYAVDYTVTGVGDAGGGDVVLITPALVDDEIVINGARANARITDLAYQKAMLPAAFNAEYDSLQIQLAEIARDLSRTLRVSVFDGGDDLVLPPVAPNKVIGFNATGQLQLIDVSEGGELVPPHLHVISDVTGLQVELDAKASANVTISGSGLASGGGDLSANRVLSVAEATEAEVRAGTAVKAISVAKAYGSLGEVAIANISACDTSAGTNFMYTLIGSVELDVGVFVVGKTGRVRFVQDATGNRDLTFAAGKFVFAMGLPPIINLAANSETIVWYDVLDAGRIFISEGARI